jgi:cysteinyl-tRNA synthetase
VRIYNTRSRKKEPFIPLEEGRVRIYVCGPTVYDDSHLGHARSAIVFDLLRRVLKEIGYEVIFVKNFTDIDDKIIKKMSESNKSLQELTNYFIDRYKSEMRELKVLDANIEPKATDNIKNIVTFIENLIKKGFAYQIDDGVYFDVTKDSSYFSLSHREMNDNDLQARIDQNSQKRDPKDFALWKFSKEDEIGFDSPWGRGRPGWHIECSAMIKAHLSTDKEYQIDIHGGGSDLIFPHHENESAQSRCESGTELAKYWIHNGFVRIDGEKMSKSLGNSFFLKDALSTYGGEVLRYYLLSTHYRSDLNFSTTDLLSAKKRLDKLYRLKQRIASKKVGSVDQNFKKELLSALEDDLNISKALSIIDEMINSANQELDTNPKNRELKATLNANFSLIERLIGIGGEDSFDYFQQGVDTKTKEKITKLIKKRDEAKKRKDFQEADKIRDELTSMGIKIMDTSEGTKWEKVSSE